MATTGIVIFFAEHVGGKLLDMLIGRITGESTRLAGMEADIGGIRTGQQQLLANQSIMLEMLQEQVEVHMSIAVICLQQAQNCEPDSVGFREYVRSAISEFNYCVALKHFSGLRKAQVWCYLAMCQHLLNQPKNAISSLKQARNLARESAKVRGEVFVPISESSPIEARLPDGTVVHGVSWTQRSVPNHKDGALAMAQELTQALQELGSR